jgi:hypothetical protein
MHGSRDHFSIGLFTLHSLDDPLEATNRNLIPLTKLVSSHCRDLFDAGWPRPTAHQFRSIPREMSLSHFHHGTFQA